MLLALLAACRTGFVLQFVVLHGGFVESEGCHGSDYVSAGSSALKRSVDL